ncbi:MAG: aminotransferase class IV [Prolixibacteraceae bacterium]
MRFVIADGKIVEKDQYKVPEIFFNNGIHLCQKIWYGYGGIPLFAENMNLFKRQAEVLKIKLPAEYENQRELFRLIKRMLNKNRFYRSGQIVLQIFAGERSVHTLVSSIAYVTFTFPIGEDGVLAAFSSQKKYTLNSMNQWPFYSEKFWQAALAENKETSVQQVIVLNENDSVCECAYGSFFVIAGNELLTPSLQSGCHENALRELISEAAAKLGLKTTEAGFISRDQIFEADELFCASEAKGIQWVMGIEKQRFIHYYSAKITEELNVLLKRKAGSNPL